MPRLHEREIKMQQAELALREKINSWVREHTEDMTDAEFIRAISGVMNEQIMTCMKYAIRRERHGNTDTPGGWADAEDHL